MGDEKVRENRLRRVAKRRGLRLTKSSRRDPRALDFGGWMLVDIYQNVVVAGADVHEYSMSLEDVEEFLG